MITLVNVVTCMLVVKQLLLFVTKLHQKTMMKQLKNILQLLHFKNCSLELAPRYAEHAMVDILVSLKLNHVVEMLLMAIIELV